MKRVAILTACLLISSVSAAADKRPIMRKVAVGQFDAPQDSRARNSVLATLSDHDDIEVISLEDISFEAHRVKADPNSQAGREKIADALGVEFWIDGAVDGSQAHLKLISTAGRRVAIADIRATTPSLLDALVGEKMWAAMGPHLSAKENRRRTLLDQAELARTKIADREHEVARQAEVALQRAQQRERRLKAEHELALSKRAALLGEVSRQEKLVEERKLSAERERQRSIEAQQAQQLAAQRAEQRRQQQQQRALLTQQQRTMAYAGPTNTGWSGGANNPYQGSASQGYQGYSASPRPSSDGGGGGGVSASTQRWLQGQGAPAPSAAPAQAAQPAQPAPADYAPPAPAVSPATQRWLAQQQRH